MGEGEPQVGLARAFFKLRADGPAWLLRRLQSEWVLPTTRPGKTLQAAVRRILRVSLAPARAVHRMLPASMPQGKDTLISFYDLKVQPVTFDVLWFLVCADLERRRLGLNHVHIVIVPGPTKGVRQEDAAYEAVVDREARRWRIFNILLEAFNLLPSCSGFTLADSRDTASALRSAAGNYVYPRDYEPWLPHPHYPYDWLMAAQTGQVPIGVLRAPLSGLRYIEQWASNYSHGRRLLTITVRDYAYGKARNSNIAAWSEFAGGLDPSTWWPVFVLDTERTLDPLPEALQGFDVVREASWNIGLRMALYERAWLNLGINNGPMGLCWLNDRTRYITFKIVTPSVPQTTVEFIRSRGFEPNESLPFATPFQKWVWEDDTVEVIRREFKAMVTAIEAHERESTRVQSVYLED